MEGGGVLTCSRPLDEQRGLGAHRTLFEHLHHSPVSGCSHGLLVDLQDQVSLDEAGGRLRAGLQHLDNSSNKLIDALCVFCTLLEQEGLHNVISGEWTHYYWQMVEDNYEGREIFWMQRLDLLR